MGRHGVNRGHGIEGAIGSGAIGQKSDVTVLEAVEFEGDESN